MRRVERQFVSIAVVILLVVGGVLTITTILLYRVHDIVHQVEIYFGCLQVREAYTQQTNQTGFDNQG